jgi:23S rRNA (guanine2445-N2)-methyltransferase / 23S rRNA (guanine2069-N7)-methyltransferase
LTTGLSKTQFLYEDFFSKSPCFQAVVSCASGFEAFLADELHELLGKGADSSQNIDRKIEPANACVILEADLKAIYEICLWSRLAEQVLVNLAEIQILEKTQADAREVLYSEIKKIPWEKLFGLEHSFKIESSGKQTVFDDERFSALVFKDAVADKFRYHYEKRPSVEKENADVILQLFGDGNRFQVQLNVSGERLHKRGYRQESVEAPLRETLAAALLRQMQWNARCSEVDYFLDPCCGSGTLVVEALMMAADIAPGILRSKQSGKGFGFYNLSFHQEALWTNLVEQAQARLDLGLDSLKSSGLKFRAYDSDNAAVKVCRANLQTLSLENYVHVERRAFAHIRELKKEGKLHSEGLVVCNPPYGERLQEANELKFLYRFLGERLRSEFSHWHVGVISSQVELLDALAFREYQQARFYNGNLKCIFRFSTMESTKAEAVEGAMQGARQEKNDISYFVRCLKSQNKASSEEDDKELDKELNRQAVDFQNRIIKNLKKLRPWLNKNDVKLFRIYDADMPEFNLAIDAYEKGGEGRTAEGKSEPFLMVSEYAPPKSVDQELAKKRLNLALQSLRQLFDLRREHIFIKTRQKQKGSSQYNARTGSASGKKTPFIVVQESGLNFLLNPVDYLDTGLFLDHRVIRKRIFEEARGKRFLNLFAYTGSASVYAAAGGAKSTLSVDLSENYLVWARQNLLANGFSLDEHTTKTADVMRWLSDNKDQYDLIFIDPPTFSNTKKKNLTFDVQTDHESLIEKALARLDGQGVIYFSTNFRRFEFSKKIEEICQVEEISRETVSPDFSRKQPHRCWEIRKTN